MKKFFIVAIVALVCLGLTLPAVAKIKVGGMITQDVMYFSQNDSRARSQAGVAAGPGAFPANSGVPKSPVAFFNPDSSFSVVDFRLPQPFNRINVAYSNDDNTIRGFVEIRGGTNAGPTQDMQNALGNGSAFVWNYAYIDWVLSPNDFIRFGRQTQAFAIRAPSQMVGSSRGHVVGNQFGNLHGGTTRDGVRWYHTFTDTVKMEIALYDPDNDAGGPRANEAIGAFSPEVVSGSTATIFEENVLPRIDVTVPLNFGSFRLWPSFTYLQQKYDQVAIGAEDSVDIWGFALGAQAKFGPLTFNAEFGFGENLGVGNYVGAAFATPAGWNSNAAVAGAGNDAINDAKVTAWWLDVGWKIGPATIHGIVGSSTYKREDDPTTGVTAAGLAMGTNLDQTTWMYGISVPISVAKGFTIRPEMMGYDLDTGATVGNVTERDMGKEYIIGVQFMLVF